MEGILVIGPREWGIDHNERLKSRAFTSMQYSARNIDDAQHRLSSLARPFPLFIYTPHRYRGVPNGSGTVEFACRTVDFKVSRTPIPSPWPTLDGPKWYDDLDHPDFRYEFWFKVDLIEKCSIPVTQFDYHRKSGLVSRPDSVAAFIGPARRNVLFVSSNFEFTKPTTSEVAASALATEEVTHGDPASIPDEEGRKRIVQHVAYERSAKNRWQAIEIHGTTCMICGFVFNSLYGDDLAQHYIEVHHIVPLSQRPGSVDPSTDLICVCSNCHSMLHRRPGVLVSVDELRERIKRYSGAT